MLNSFWPLLVPFTATLRDGCVLPGHPPVTMLVTPGASVRSMSGFRPWWQLDDAPVIHHLAERGRWQPRAEGLRP